MSLGTVHGVKTLFLREQIGTYNETGSFGIVEPLRSPLIRHPDGRWWTISWEELIRLADKAFRGVASEHEVVMLQIRDHPINDEWWSEWSECLPADYERIKRKPIIGDREFQVRQLYVETDEKPNTHEASTAAIVYACTLDSHDCKEFLSYWNEGEFEFCRRLYPDAPDAVYIGADPLHGKRDPL